MKTTKTIKGRVKDFATNSALPFVKVVPLSADGKVIAKYGTTSKNDGTFSLEIPLASVNVPMSPTPVMMPVADRFKVVATGIGEKIVPLVGKKDHFYEVEVSDESKQQEYESVTIKAQRPQTKCASLRGTYNSTTKKCLVPKKKSYAKYIVLGVLALAAVGAIAYGVKIHKSK